MQYITATQLRTMSIDLFRALDEGKTVDLIRKSKIIAEIRPKIHDPRPFDPVRFAKLVKKLNLPELSDKEIERRYRKHLMEKYGKNISRH